MEKFLHSSATQQPTLFRLSLKPASWVFRNALKMRRFLFNIGIITTKRLPGYVISVGNITVGGTGKSPFVIALAEYLRAKGYRPAILARGYRSGLQKNDSVVFFGEEELLTSKFSGHIYADEARMQAAILKDVPVVVGQARYRAAINFLTQTQYKPTHWLLDDGFQHWRLHRDLDVVLLDARQPFGNGQLLPLGTLREPIAALQRAHWVVFTRSQGKADEALAKILQNTDIKSFLFSKMDFLPLQFVGKSFNVAEGSNAREFGAVCAIANPQDFLTALKDQGIKIKKRLVLSDHALFDFAVLEEFAKGIDAIVTTEKDYWRDPRLFAKIKIPVYVLPMRINIQSLDMGKIFAKLPT